MGATIPARILPGSIDHVPFPTVGPCLGASLPLREKARRGKPGAVGKLDSARRLDCPYRRG